MSQMEDDAARFLKRVVWSLSSGLLWLIINLSIGIYAGWMVPENGLRLGNILFYVWMLLSLGLLIWVNYRIWKEEVSAWMTIADFEIYGFLRFLPFTRFSIVDWHSPIEEISKSQNQQSPNY